MKRLSMKRVRFRGKPMTKLDIAHAIDKIHDFRLVVSGDYRMFSYDNLRSFLFNVILCYSSDLIKDFSNLR